ncbi:hypothetical protein KBTX_00926 [wastewater metagenome]|uniref:Uncharacterized protein n=2 Tax=unclassified sequences TaxID=12908 RepID=A0A5B8R9N9_9ZZZZ|nr:hypothetical protein KBTEX_00926 [uncultured organism]
MVLAGEQDAGDPRVDGQPRDTPAQLGERLGVVQRTEFAEQPQSVADVARVRRLDEGEGVDVAEPEVLHLQDHRGKVGPQDLRVGELGPGLVVILAVEADAHAGGDTPAAPGALVRACLGDRFNGQALDLGAVAVAAQAHQAAVDDVADAGHGQRGLGDVGREHHPPPAVGGEHALLLCRGEPAEQRQDLGTGGMVLAQCLRGLANVAFARQEYQHVPWSVAGELVDGIEDALLETAVALVLVLAGEGAIAHLHRVGPPGDVDDRRITEVPGETLRVDRGRGDDDLQVRPPGQEVFQVAEQEVDVEAALVGLVDDDRVVVGEVRVALGLGEEHAVGGELHPGAVGDMVTETDLVADPGPDLGAAFLGDPGGQTARGDAPRLAVRDHAGHTAAEVKADLGQLGALAGAGLAADHHHLVLPDGLGDIVPALDDREIEVEIRTQRTGGTGVVPAHEALHVRLQCLEPAFRAPAAAQTPLDAAETPRERVPPRRRRRLKDPRAQRPHPLGECTGGGRRGAPATSPAHSDSSSPVSRAGRSRRRRDG